jgi:hypothetical protein
MFSKREKEERISYWHGQDDCDHDCAVKCALLDEGESEIRAIEDQLQSHNTLDALTRIVSALSRLRFYLDAELPILSDKDKARRQENAESVRDRTTGVTIE